MTADEKIEIEYLIESIVRKIDSSMNFVEQVSYIKKKLAIGLLMIDSKIDINDPELETLIKNNVVIKEKDALVFEAKGFKPWLDEARLNIDWKFYNRYEKYLLTKKKWNWGAIQSINEITDTILDHIKNPQTKNAFAIKGLVMGDIQSGKTANYTALINKALDAGYKLIIVLAGMTKDLRSQTQKRLDKEVMGYETRPDLKNTGVVKGDSIGVGETGDPTKTYYINTITHSGEIGDLKKISAANIVTQLNTDMQPLIAVLKKNSSVLTALNDNFLNGEVHSRTNGKLDVPTLIIDDEVDQASVNTKNTKAIEEASSINKLIRKILKKFNRYAYVGYTATPFANVFINPYGFQKEDEKDIFPEDFIICLPRPKGYSGVKEYFGITPINEDDDALTLDLYKRITDYYDLFDDYVKASKKIVVDTPVIRINKSMHDAFMHFIIASAVKYARGIVEHNSMLIHIARFKNAATSMRELVKNELSKMLKEYKYGKQSERDKYKKFWEDNIKTVSVSRLGDEFSDNWEEIEKNIVKIFDMSINGIKIVNGDSGDVCDYDNNYVGQHIIIGGDKLSRGLTLEGLIVSYYYRKSRTYDALLQMGRWFGYRNGWIDLCRIYTVNEFVNSFINAGIATENFKLDINDMNSLKLTPADFGLKIQYSPKLAPTSISKMRSAQRQKISFSASLQQLISYQKEYISHNREVTSIFVDSLGTPIVRENNNIVFKNVTANQVIKYLKSYKECDDLAGFVSIVNWIRYIEKLAEKGELINWTVVLHSNTEDKNTKEDVIGKYTINKMQRTDRNLDVTGSEENFYLKVLTNPRDFREFFDEDSNEYKNIKEYNPNDPDIKKKFTCKDALLTIYSMDIHKKLFVGIKNEEGKKPRKVYTKGEILPNGEGVIGLGAWFPEASDYKDSAVYYYVNQVYLDSQKEIEAEEDSNE